jgi:hypothetical protein
MSRAPFDDLGHCDAQFAGGERAARLASMASTADAREPAEAALDGWNVASARRLGRMGPLAHRQRRL